MCIDFKTKFPLTHEIARVIDGLSVAAKEFTFKLKHFDMILTDELELDMNEFYRKVNFICLFHGLKFKKCDEICWDDLITSFMGDRFKRGCINEDYICSKHNFPKKLKNSLVDIDKITSLFGSKLFKDLYDKMKNNKVVLKISDNENYNRTYISDKIPVFYYNNYIDTIDSTNQYPRYMEESNNDEIVFNSNEKETIEYNVIKTGYRDVPMDEKILNYNLYNSELYYTNMHMYDGIGFCMKDWISFLDAFFYSIVFPHILYRSIIDSVVNCDKFDLRNGVISSNINYLDDISRCINEFIEKFLLSILVDNFNIEYFELCESIIDTKALNKIKEYLSFVDFNLIYRTYEKDSIHTYECRNLIGDVNKEKKSIRYIKEINKNMCDTLEKIIKCEREYIDNTIKPLFKYDLQ